MLIKGKWSEDWQPVQAVDDKGGFVRQTSSFRHWITVDGSAGPTGDAGFKAESGRYHLYAALICPWASRTLIAREFKGLAEHISVSIVEPVLTAQGWQFGDDAGATVDHLQHYRYLHQLYTLADPMISGRATVPVLWDKQRQTIVNNESSDILRMLNSAFVEVADSAYDLYPIALSESINAFNQRIYENLNNGVYRAGFATTQQAYEQAYDAVFASLAELEQHFAHCQFAVGECLTESDIRLFVTLIRFDVAYYSLFKCNFKRIADYPHLQAYLQRLISLPQIAKTVNLDHIKRGYYSIKALNPNGIVPKGPTLSLNFPQLEV